MPDVAVWNQCNSHCVMCTNESAFQKEAESVPYSFAQLTRRWAHRRMNKGDAICLTGGEPTIHPDFLKIVRWFRAHYPHRTISVATNGRMLSYAGFAKKLLAFDDLVIEIALHGHDARSHDSITRAPGSFRQTVEGIRNVLRFRRATQALELRLIVTRLTYRRLGKILSFVAKVFDPAQIRDIAIIFLEMEGQARDNARLVGVSYRKARPAIVRAVRAWQPCFRDLRLLHFPLCTVPQRLWPLVWRTQRKEETLFAPSCRHCKVRAYCMGIHRDYAALMGKGEFRPVRRHARKIIAGASFYKPIDAIQ